MRIAVQRQGPVATVRVSGGLTEIGTGHLAALLDAMATTGCEYAIVHLADVTMVDSGLLRVLRAARTRLQGRLTVTAERTEARFPLALVGFGGGAWPARHDLGAGGDHVRP
jgi:anti-anti-sigma regulatory factor